MDQNITEPENICAEPTDDKLFFTDVDSSNNKSIKSRLGICEVCDVLPAKYACPACEFKSCSLTCCNLHKKELNCSGMRNRVQYKPISRFSNLDLQNDYILLEEMGRSIESLSKNRKIHQKNLKLRWHKLRWRAQKKGIHLQLLPPTFDRHLKNTTFHNWSNNTISWRIEWIFNEDRNNPITVPTIRYPENGLIKDALIQCIDEHSDKLMFWKENLDISNVKVLMKVEKLRGNKYVIIDVDSTLMDVLIGKIIIEFPTFVVLTCDQLKYYTIIKDDSEAITEEAKNSGLDMRPKNSLKFFSDVWSDGGESEENNT